MHQARVPALSPAKSGMEETRPNFRSHTNITHVSLSILTGVQLPLVTNNIPIVSTFASKALMIILA